MDPDGERYLTRRDGVLDRYGDPACWAWPVPDFFAFRDDKSGEAFLEWWNRRCAICDDSVPLVRDHDHETLLVRGWLCRNCNIREGYASDADADVFYWYRWRNPATILGIRVRYRAPRSGPLAPVSGKASEERFTAQLRAVRESAGLSQQEVAALMREKGFGFHQQTVARIEWGKQPLRLGEAYALAEILGSTVEAMAGTAATEQDGLTEVA